MSHQIIKTTLEINSPISRVWSIFTNPNVTKNLGGYYACDWKIGSSFCFLINDNVRLTNGILLAYEELQLIKHSLFEPKSEKVSAIITYNFQEGNGCTILTGTEELVVP